MNKTKDSTKAMLREQWKKACNGYLVELLRMWELDAHYGYWTGDEHGTTYCYGETHNLTMEEIIFIVEADIEEDEVLAWEDYLLDAHEFNFDLPNLRAWHYGCPRTPQETFDRLRGLKDDLAKEVEKEKKRIKNEKRENVHCVVQIPDDEVGNVTSIEEYVRECFQNHPERIRYEKK